MAQEGWFYNSSALSLRQLKPHFHDRNTLAHAQRHGYRPERPLRRDLLIPAYVLVMEQHGAAEDAPIML